ncbi:glycosyltransferase family 4 protein [Rhodocyclus tenuis]|uniref:Glycosyltransferase involved in cell wall biosynthesis n=1 Tax=Rhodocyclus tenuis TaxID=1066 RepID=A0A840G5N7_RHOTE|nr:glycosyltransferase family 4 protein [Rhodocyclus tenuis]MBB4247205.1 glycosyltransferase involved in cell wall biosynthesis [Rhodocyclus tenuis]
MARAESRASAREIPEAKGGASASIVGHGAEPTICIVQAVAKQYREPFFDALYFRLKNQGIRLQVIYSDPNSFEARRKDAVDLPPSYGRKVHALWLFRQRVLFQRVPVAALTADLVIVEQASKYVLNYVFALLSTLGILRLAYWGHGRNWQQPQESGMGRVKRAMLRRADWWFAYTARVADYVRDNGFSSERITVVQNSVDTSGLRQQINDFDEQARAALREELGIARTDRVGLFCGSMHTDKQLAFLVRAAVELRNRLPGFHLILVGAGPDETIARTAAAKHAWVHHIGPQFGGARVPYFAIADVFLCPGLVGLAVLDAFAAGLPLFTTDIPIHSPEIDYLEDGINGGISEFDPAIYAENIGKVLASPGILAQMKSNAEASAQRYGLDVMVENFFRGVLACLDRS